MLQTYKCTVTLRAQLNEDLHGKLRDVRGMEGMVACVIGMVIRESSVVPCSVTLRFISTCSFIFEYFFF